MAKKAVKNETVVSKPKITMNQLQHAAFNSLLRRRELIQSLLSPGRDIDKECGYPDTITKQNYKTMYDRVGPATRVVELWPEESWSQTPDIYEKEEAEKTEFERAWEETEKKHQIFHYMNRIDVLSGIGQFGLVLFGIDDGKDLSLPVDGIDLKTGEATKKNKYRLLYIRTYDESVVEIDSKETDQTSPRFGFPLTYTIKQEDVSSGMKTVVSRKVHWTRVLHVADNRVSSEVYGTPRMQRVYNSLLDLRKILGGSGEMFWRGGFPGLAFELGGDAGMQEVSDETKEAMQENIADYFAGLDRSLLLENVQVKPLAPQVADPSGHIDMQLKAISLSIGVPYRVFMGAEQAKIASTQDKRTWNERIMKRQNKYLTPMLIRPWIDRFIAYGVLPMPATYYVDWPDREALTDKDVVEVAVKEVDAMAKYVQGNVSALMSPKDFFVSVLKKESAEAVAFEDGVRGMEGELEGILDLEEGEGKMDDRQKEDLEFSAEDIEDE
ncbi:MAG: DUF1073 domain-containing protein [bacterium]|nr:DUF1073 domain-containing protein [bacterium]